MGEWADGSLWLWRLPGFGLNPSSPAWCLKLLETLFIHLCNGDTYAPTPERAGKYIGSA